uniref:hypothetical protein n=1 Tax=uncultured Boseongicola sp. TaxID=1648499 RepID=UPI0026091DEF
FWNRRPQCAAPENSFADFEHLPSQVDKQKIFNVTEISSQHGIVRLNSRATLFERILGWFELLMFGESQPNIEICPICERIGAEDAAILV